MCHVNVTGDWKVVELGHLLCVAVCQMLAGYSRVCVCGCGLCVQAQLHAFIPTDMCILCRLVFAWVHVLELHMRFTSLLSLPGILLFSSACPLVDTARMSSKKVFTPNIIHTIICSLDSAASICVAFSLDGSKVGRLALNKGK